MTKIMNRVLQDIQILSSNEKNDLMKILIASMDENHDNDSYKFWADIAKNRFEEIESKKVQTLNWNQIKQQVLS